MHLYIVKVVFHNRDDPSEEDMEDYLSSGQRARPCKKSALLTL